jgi:hypothetical protein
MTMDARWIAFGEIEVDGKRYTHDVIIDGGEVRKRSKKPSKAFRGQFGHTPLSAEESLPWGGSRLVVGTGAYGSLPVMPEVEAEARRRKVDLVVLPTPDALELLCDIDAKKVFAVLHVTC